MAINNYLQNKQQLKILLLGAYKPAEALNRLKKLQVCMMRKGFVSTMLAKDFPDATRYSEDLDEHYTMKSGSVSKFT